MRGARRRVPRAVAARRATSSSAATGTWREHRHTNVTFVGEPTGSRPGFFGDHRLLALPNGWLYGAIPELWWQTQNPRDHRPWVAPLVAAGATADEYRRGVDPALDAVIEAEVDTAASRLPNDGKTAAAVALFRVDTEAFPQSANAYDRLGEGYERAGERARAEAASRKALALDPRMGASRAGLQRLGVVPPGAPIP